MQHYLGIVCWSRKGLGGGWGAWVGRDGGDQEIKRRREIYREQASIDATVKFKLPALGSLGRQLSTDLGLERLYHSGIVLVYSYRPVLLSRPCSEEKSFWPGL